MPSGSFPPGFATPDIETSGARIHLATGGRGLLLLLLCTRLSHA
jgi:hypothetical protein